MRLLKKSMLTVMLLSTVLFTATPVVAYETAVTISGLIWGVHLAAFDLNVNYDATLLTFDSYTLTDELGSLSEPAGAPDAQDWSLGDDGSGTVNLSVLSYLLEFSGQPDAFTLATLSFSGDADAMTSISLSEVVLYDESGDQISIQNVSGTHICIVPIPGTIWLLGTMLGVGGIIRRRTLK